jgi:hypothetical protein
MGQEYIAQAGQLLVSFEPAEARGCLLHGNRDRKLAESLCPRRSASYASEVDFGTAITDGDRRETARNSRAAGGAEELNVSDWTEPFNEVPTIAMIIMVLLVVLKPF